ncbi:hypothetical protein B0H19DRAFT_1370337 [Mycena capillaripes]|nr:hypothetical protein B0H19DRAFT_1370337 [Mycena capillaripes]
MPDRLPEIFQGISTFNYFLENNIVGHWLAKVTIVIHLRGPGQISSSDGQQLDLNAEPEAAYFSMRNDSDEDLFPYLFYFDPHMYSIQSLYKPNNADKADPPLKAAGGTLWAHGEGGEGFQLSPRTIGFLKLFVAKEPLDINWIPQISPFDPRFKPNEGRAVLSPAFPTWQGSVKAVTPPV